MIAQQGLSSTANPSTLPPTSSAVKMHSRRVILQVQSSYDNELDPMDFDWEMQAGNLLPVVSGHGTVPELLLKLIYCDYQVGRNAH
jgi:hypothetical protein